MAGSLRFILIDDDPVCNSICRLIIRRALGETVIRDFIYPEEGLKFIEMEFPQVERQVPVILFLDINMPTMTAWEFLDEFHALGEKIKKEFLIYILSSSIDSSDKKRAQNNPYVIDYIEKPLVRQVLMSIAETQKRHFG